MEKLKNNIIFYILLLIDFYVLPNFIKDTGSAMFVLMIIIPVICFIISFFYGMRNGFDIWYVLIVAILFIPSIFVFYNFSAWIYTVVYTALAIIGNVVALPLKRR
ncbi:MAG: hypothetical protein Q4E02_02545 [Lagierella massiliensis]|nr:hypothetical protein [Lagierella massiliensis]